MPITAAEAVLNVCGDFHYGATDVSKTDIISPLNRVVDKHRGNIFRVFTGDLTENQLKTSVGHNYDSEIADPAVQKRDMIDVLRQTNRHLYGENKYRQLKINKGDTSFNGVLSVGVGGNHEYRTRKVAAQWLSEDMHDASKVLDMGFGGIIELTISNKKLKLEKTYKIYVTHRPSKTTSTSDEAILRAFRKKQSILPGIDIIIFGHSHKRFLYPSSYTNIETGEQKKILYAVNPSPMQISEYAEEAGYPPLEADYFINIYLPLDPIKPIYGYV
jgi:predicted phosphodiesterase